MSVWKRNGRARLFDALKSVYQGEVWSREFTFCSVISASCASDMPRNSAAISAIRRMLAGVLVSWPSMKGLSVSRTKSVSFKASKATRTFLAFGLSSSEPMPILKPSFTKIRASSTLPEKA